MPNLFEEKTVEQEWEQSTLTNGMEVFRPLSESHDHRVVAKVRGGAVFNQAIDIDILSHPEHGNHFRIISNAELPEKLQERIFTKITGALAELNRLKSDDFKELRTTSLPTVQELFYPGQKLETKAVVQRTPSVEENPRPVLDNRRQRIDGWWLYDERPERGGAFSLRIGSDAYEQDFFASKPRNSPFWKLNTDQGLEDRLTRGLFKNPRSVVIALSEHHRQLGSVTG